MRSIPPFSVPAFCAFVICGIWLASPLSVSSALAHEVPLPAPRLFGRGAVVGQRVYLFGGGYADFDVFDTNERKWSRIAAEIPLSKSIYGDQIDGKLYLLDAVSRRLVSFDPATKVTKTLRPVPTHRVNGTVIAAGGKLYVIGGYADDITEKNCVAVYDPLIDAWTDGPPLPGYQPRDHFHCAALLDGKLHVVGGLLKENRDQPHFRLDGDRWTRLADAPLHATWKHADLTAAAGRLYLLCPLATLPNNRQNPSRNPDNFYRYDPAADHWNAIGRAPEGTPFVHFISATVGDRIYYFGGLTHDGRAAQQVRIYNVIEGHWK